MFKRCKICGAPAASDSQLCEQHKAEASRLASSFGLFAKPAGKKKKEGKKKKRAKSKESEAQTEPQSKQKADTTEPEEHKSAGEEPKVDHPEVAAKNTEEPQAPEKQDSDSPESDSTNDHRSQENATASGQLLLLLDRGQAALVEKLESSEEKAGKWAQLSVYYCGGELMVRPYFSVVPNAASKKAPRYSMVDLKALFQDKNALASAFVSLFEEHASGLQARKLHTLDMHFVDYAGGVCINVTNAEQKEENLQNFKYTSGEFREDSDDEVRAAMSHERW